MLLLQILVIAASVGLAFYTLFLVKEGIRIGKRIERVSEDIQSLKTMYDKTLVEELRGLSRELESLKSKTEGIVTELSPPKPRVKKEVEILLPPSLSELVEGPLKELADTVPLLKRMYSFLVEMVFPKA
ncbi:MAG TPA: hypothetical protein VNK96_00430 [Fimbriimonadales bacterium]|nr:hypothetical protein [Fimbriimonadales bacterium]